MKFSLTKSALLSAALIFPAPLIFAQASQYEILGQKKVWGKTYYTVRNTEASGGEEAYGVLDPKGNFHACGNEPCGYSDVMKAAQSKKSSGYVPKSSSSSSSSGGDYSRGGGGGGGGGGGM